MVPDGGNRRLPIYGNSNRIQVYTPKRAAGFRDVAAPAVRQGYPTGHCDRPATLQRGFDVDPVTILSENNRPKARLAGRSKSGLITGGAACVFSPASSSNPKTSSSIELQVSDLGPLLNDFVARSSSSVPRASRVLVLACARCVDKNSTRPRLSNNVSSCWSSCPLAGAFESTGWLCCAPGSATRPFPFDRLTRFEFRS